MVLWSIWNVLGNSEVFLELCKVFQVRGEEVFSRKNIV